MKEKKGKKTKKTNPISRRLSPSNSLHHTPLLVRYIAHPVRLARRNQHMGRPTLDLPVQLVLLVDLEAARVADGAGRAVMVAVVAVNFLGDHGKEVLGFAGFGA